MDSGDLTAKQFWRLSHGERLKRCGELSAHEAFLMRVPDPHLPISPPCNQCKHYLGYARCEVYLDGISADQIRAVMEDPAIECGNGFRFTPKE